MSAARLLYSVEQVRAFDRRAIEVLHIPGYTLMKRAGEAALRALRSRWPRATQIAVVCGGGNNGGDGYVLARFGQAAGLKVVALAAVPTDQLRGEARRAADEFLSSGGRVDPISAAALLPGEVIVDALLGTGVREPLRPEAQLAISAINHCGRPVLALDLPSGLDGDSGQELGEAVRADCTITFVAAKCGLLLGAGPECTGRLIVDDLDVPTLPGGQGAPVLECLDARDIAHALPSRPRQAHKGDFGRVLIIGGAPGMPGAVRLAGEACLRVGAGLVHVACAPVNVAAIGAGRPELMSLGLESAADLAPLLRDADVVAIGPGLGRADWSRQLWSAALGSGKPLVIDADALNLLAESGQRAPQAILTPHPGEAARLLGTDSASVQRDRVGALKALVARHDGVVILKGAGTLVGAAGHITALCASGNPGMASAGMGDVLTGAVAGILAQCRDPWQAAVAAVQAHAMAGDELAHSHGQRGILALEVAAGLTRWVNGQA
ncbi:MAG TPA: NAD(P)H-hydrate dehydratase [Steroidobacteraceae bacterium]